MNLRNIVNKITTVSLAALTVDAWRMAKNDQSRVQAQIKLQTELDKLNKDNYDKALGDMATRTKIEASTGRIIESQSEIERLAKKSNSIIDELNKGGLDQEKKDQLMQELKRNLDRKTDLVNKVTDQVKNINDYFTKNDLSGIIQDFINWYKEFLSNLSVEQLGCLANGIGFSIIISAVNALALTHYGNKIINYFNLETKFPKLAKFIQIRSKLSDKFIKFQILYIYLTSIVMLVINIYMFFS